MKRNNKGLSLVEIVIVVAIMSVLAGLVSIGVGTVISKPAEECARKMDSVLKNARMTTMGKQNVWIEFSQSNAGDPIFVTEVIKEPGASSPKSKQTEIGKKGITATVVFVDSTTGATTSKTLASCDKIVMSYSRATGGFNKTEVWSGGAIDDNTKYVQSITITKGSMTKTLEFAYLTGKVLVK